MLNFCSCAVRFVAVLCCTIHWFTSSSSARAKPNLPELQAKCLPGLVPKQTNKFYNLSSKLFPKYTKKVAKFGLKVLTGKALPFWLEFFDKTGKTFFVYKCKLTLSLGLLYLVELFINKLKVNLIIFLTEWF